MSALKTYCFTFLVVTLKWVKKVGTYNPNGSNTSMRAGGELHCSATHHQCARSSRHLAAPRTPYAAFVKEIINYIAPEDGRIGPKHVELK